MEDIVQQDQAMVAEDLLYALQNQERRRILKFAVDSGGPVSPSMASKELHAPLRSTSKHFRVLAEVGLIVLTTEVSSRGATQHFYLPAGDMLEHPIVQAVLGCMQE
jgi:predicted transcriptional regulator